MRNLKKLSLLFIAVVFSISCNNIKSLNASFDVITDDNISVPDEPPDVVENGKKFPNNFTVQDNAYFESQNRWNYSINLETERGKLKNKKLNLQTYSKFIEYTSGIDDPKEVLDALSIRDPNVSTGQLQLDINSSIFDALGSKGQRAKIKVDIYINSKGYNTGIRTVYLDIKRIDNKK